MYFIKKLIGNSWTNTKINIDRITKINCFEKGFNEKIESKEYAWDEEKIFPKPSNISNPKPNILIQSILTRLISFIYYKIILFVWFVILIH